MAKTKGASRRGAATRRVSTRRIAKPDALAAAPQESATFELGLLVEGGNVLRTRLAHVQSGDEYITTGWDAREALARMGSWVGVNLWSDPATQPPNEIAIFEDLERSVSEVCRAGQSVATLFGPSAPADGGCAPLSSSLSLTMAPANELQGGEMLRTMIQADQAWKMRLSVGAPPSDAASAWQCHAVVQARQMGSGAYFIVAEKTVELSGDSPHTFTLDAQPLPAGLYRMEAGVQLSSSSTPVAHPFSCWEEGALLRVY